LFFFLVLVNKIVYNLVDNDANEAGDCQFGLPFKMQEAYEFGVNPRSDGAFWASSLNS
jgi:hypothetical protein